MEIRIDAHTPEWAEERGVKIAKAFLVIES